MTESFASSSTPTGAPRSSTADPATPPVPKVAVRTLGCKVNRVESEVILAELLGKGAILAEEPDASVILVNTCTVTGEADRKVRKAVRQALSASENALVFVTGCAASVDPESLAALGERVVVEPDKSRVSGLMAARLGLSEAPGPAPVRAGEGFRSRAMLKVEDGCDNRCSYCIVPDARGVPVSEPLAGLAREARALADAGVGEIVVTGINVGRYRDPGTDADLATLLATLAAAGPARLRLSSIEPPDLTDGFLDAVGSLTAFCPHLHVPLQSGSDRILGLMNRAYTAEEYLARVAAAGRALPGLSLSTDVIVGFPGETDADHERTLEVCRAAGFSKIHVFRYSARPGTPAAALPDRVPPETAAARAAGLRTSAAEMRAAWLEGFEGREVEVLVERLAEDGSAEGTTREYAKVRIACATGGVRPGAVVRVRIGGRSGEVLLAGL